VVFPVPTSLSPSRVESFTNCPLQFRFASIEKLPEPTNVHAAKGSLVHRALELVFYEAAGRRSPELGAECLAQAIEEFAVDPEFVELGLAGTDLVDFCADAEKLMAGYFRMEDPNSVREIGLELRLEASVGDLSLRGIIDRLELDEQGDLVVTDYKTGRPPYQNREQQRLGGVNFYAFLCQEVLGRRPSKIRLMYLRTGETIEATPSDQSVKFLTRRAAAVYQAVAKACDSGDFRPRTGPLCNFCAFQTWCPSYGGDPTLAATEARARTIPVIAA